MQVALDPAVSDKAYRVFTVIAAHGKGNIANVGQRRVARLMGKTQSYISKRVKELRRSGWVGTKEVGTGKRTVYVRLSSDNVPPQHLMAQCQCSPGIDAHAGARGSGGEGSGAVASAQEKS
jgi:hypothetical protein